MPILSIAISNIQTLKHEVVVFPEFSSAIPLSKRQPWVERIILAMTFIKKGSVRRSVTIMNALLRQSINYVKPNTQVDLRLDSNCELDLVAMSWDEDRCPTDKHATTIQKECEMNTKPEGGTLRLTTVNNPQTYLIAVDGQQGDYGNFRLTINCKTYR